MADSQIDDDWLFEDFPKVMGMIGAAAIEPMEALFFDKSKLEDTRILASAALAAVALRHGERRAEILAIFQRYLDAPEEDSPVLNGAVVSDLMSLDAIELIDGIRKLFARNCVDISYVGDLEDVEIAMGLRAERETPRPDYYAGWDEGGDDSYEELGQLLLRYQQEPSVRNISELQGFLTAVICAPQMIKPSTWLPVIWGGDSHAPDWQSAEEMQAFVAEIMQMYNDVIEELQDKWFEPLLLRSLSTDAVKAGAEWCLGFVRGLALWPSLSPQEDKILENAMVPVALFISEEGEKARSMMEASDIEEYLLDIGPAMQTLYDEFVRKAPQLQSRPYVRETPKVGRNDPCPCGSGKKFKRCCLH